MYTRVEMPSGPEEGTVSLGAGVRGSCELRSVVLETELRSSSRAVHAAPAVQVYSLILGGALFSFD